MQTRFGFWFCLFGIGAAACAAPAPAPQSAPAAPAVPVAAAPPPTPAPDASAPPETAPAPSADTAPPAPEKKPEPEAEEKPSRPPVDILTSPDTAFLINYSSSAPLDAARKACADKAGADDEVIAKCMSDARDAFKADVLRFKQDGNRSSFIIYKRDGSRLDEVYSARIELSQASPSTVKIKFTGGDKGMRPILKSKREIVIQIPNDYSLVWTDPDLGRLIYEAKVGLIGS
jgi:hypothetical protein